jgi:hypothetical protein
MNHKKLQHKEKVNICLLWSKKFGGQNFHVSKMFGDLHFLSQQCYCQKNVGVKIFWGSTILGQTI